MALVGVDDELLARVLFSGFTFAIPTLLTLRFISDRFNQGRCYINGIQFKGFWIKNYKKKTPISSIPSIYSLVPYHVNYKEQKHI
jgi:hypothetical protein